MRFCNVVHSFLFRWFSRLFQIVDVVHDIQSIHTRERHGSGVCERLIQIFTPTRGYNQSITSLPSWSSFVWDESGSFLRLLGSAKNGWRLRNLNLKLPFEVPFFPSTHSHSYTDTYTRLVFVVVSVYEIQVSTRLVCSLQFSLLPNDPRCNSVVIYMHDLLDIHCHS